MYASAPLYLITNVDQKSEENFPCKTFKNSFNILREMIIYFRIQKQNIKTEEEKNKKNYHQYEIN